jgi:ABC transporter substrate binding protein (PQQ-dependent alcohol dehydrogenase system)
MVARPRPGSKAIALLLALAGLPGFAAEPVELPIGYLQVSDDPRYVQKRRYAGIRVAPRHRPLPGAELAIREARVLGRALKIKVSLVPGDGQSVDELLPIVEQLHSDSAVKFFLIDAPAEVIDRVARSTADRDLLLMNVSAPDDDLRATSCHRHLLHFIPSYAMLGDALAQFLVARKWRAALVLQGPLPADRAFTDAFTASARRYGVDVVDKRDFVLSNDPRERGRNNVKLLTSGVDYDAVFIADADGEFSRYVPYDTQLARPVVGSTGLSAAAWHWAWERHGAPQLNQRFEKRAGRTMYGPDWAAWLAVKSIVEAVSRTRSTEFTVLRDYLRGDRLRLDGYKGNPVSVRVWDNQLRQPILLHTHDAIIDRAPLQGFLHQSENLDTLGYDAGDRRCRMR